ncbi:MAG: ABC transporter ATP-binding protein [Myxococcales bacterium]|nr:ABC transporter ATP-binding protein [Myxococcales bacterium]
MTGAALLEATDLTKRYDGRAVVDALSFECRAGTVLGLLGPNGAGKTTTLRMLYGFVEPDAGRIVYGGRDFATERLAIKRELGVCTQDDSLDYDFSVEQNLRVYASYFRPRVDALDSRIAYLLDAFALRRYADASPRALSGGFIRRLLIARSIVHRPRMLYLDEPTTGLDPRARVDLWELIDQMRADGMAIVLTTHYMDEAEKLSDELLVLDEGRAVARGAPGALMGRLIGEHVLVVGRHEAARDAIGAWARQTQGVEPSVVLGELHVPVTAAQLAEVSARFPEARLTVRPPNLDDLFIRLSLRHRAP